MLTEYGETEPDPTAARAAETSLPSLLDFVLIPRPRMSQGPERLTSQLYPTPGGGQLGPVATDARRRRRAHVYADGADCAGLITITQVEK